jgi:hypothetical protein
MGEQEMLVEEKEAERGGLEGEEGGMRGEGGEEEEEEGEGLPEYFDLLLEREEVKTKQRERGELQLKKKAPGYHLTKKLSDFQILLGTWNFLTKKIIGLFGDCGFRCFPVSGGSSFRFPVSGSRFPVPGFRFPVSGSRFPVPGFRFPVSGSRFPVSGSRFPVPGFRFPVSGSRFPVPGFRFPVSGSRRIFHLFFHRE